MRGSVAYCAQVPWVMGASLRDNVLFGQSFREEAYNAALSACALEQVGSHGRVQQGLAVRQQGIGLRDAHPLSCHRAL